MAAGAWFSSQEGQQYEMDPETDQFEQLLQRLRDGAPEAATELVERYEPCIRRVVRRRLSRKMRSKFDSLDFQQDVWASFFAGATERSFDSPRALAAYLAAMAKNKVLMAIRQRCGLQKHNINRERSLDGSAAFQAECVAAADPTASQTVANREQWDLLLRRHPPRHRRILQLLREGKTQREIASEMGIDERTIRRVVHKLRPEGTR